MPERIDTMTRNGLHMLALRTIGVAAVAAVFTGCGFIGEPSVAERAAEQWPMVDRYCTDCHNGAELAGGLDFERIGPENIGAHAEKLEMAVRKLRSHAMPPPKEPRPDEEQLVAFVAWLEDALDEAAESHGYQAIVPHRLNRKEYANAIRDLLTLEIDPTEFLPQDEEVKHFDNIAGGLQVSPSFVEQYVGAARQIAVRAVGRPDARTGGQTYFAPPGRQQAHVAGLPLGTRGGFVVTHMFPSDGEYEVNVADMFSHIWGNDSEFENTLVVTLDNKIVYEATLGGEEDQRLYDQVQDGAMEKVNARLKDIRFTSTAGPHKVGVTFRRRTFAESDDQIQMFVPGGGQDRVFRVASFEVSGPYNPTGLSATPSRDRVFVCHPSRGDDEQICAERILSELATRAYRRPLAEEDLQELLAYYRDGVAANGFEEGIRSGLTGILASPYFLYRIEMPPADLEPGQTYAIDDVTLASKLSFFLWNTIPDDELRDLAVRGELSDERVLRAQVERMLEDPRAETLANNFVYHWLDLKRLEEVEPDTSIFPYASGRGDPREDYLTELELFSKSIFDEDRSVVDFMTASHTYLNERVALLYGINSVKGDRFQRVELEDSTRWGLLGKGAILMAAAYPNRTSPVLRGAFILEYIAGAPPATPPPNVEAFPEAEIGTAKARTVRDIIAQHRENPTCFACHGVMDPLGFALENFDAVGVWRDVDRYAGTAIDSAAELPDGTPVSGPDDLRDALMRNPEQFVQTFTERFLMYALGRTVDYKDMPAVRKIVREAGKEDYRFSELVWQVVASEPFRMRRAAEPPSQVVAQAAAE
jgi:mono/diheme cytochrome c family protein